MTRRIARVLSVLFLCSAFIVPLALQAAAKAASKSAAPCVDLQAEKPKTVPGPKFKIQGIQFINPVYKDGSIGTIEVRDFDHDGKNDLVVGSSNADKSPLTVELPLNAAGRGPTIAFVEAKRPSNSTSLTIEAVDATGTVVDTQSLKVVGSWIRLPLMWADGIVSIRIIATEVLIDRICWS